MVFADRRDAGRQLASKLAQWRDEPVVVLGLPRGGIPVAFKVARALDAPLDVIVSHDPILPPLRRAASRLPACLEREVSSSRVVLRR